MAAAVVAGQDPTKQLGNMMKSPSPAFSLYPKDILSDEQCTAMSHEELGAYVRLLCHAWLEGSIPKDRTKLARMLRVKPAKLAKIWAAIEPCWGIAPDAEDRLVQARLERERELQVERRANQRAKGQKGGRPKESTKGQSPGLAGAKPDESLPSPSPSPSPSPTGKQKRTGADARRPTYMSEAIDDHREFLGEPSPGRLGAALKPLVEAHGWDVVRPMWRDKCRDAATWAEPARFTPEVFARTFKAELAKRRVTPPPSGGGEVPQPRPLRDRADRAMTDEEIARVRADREAAFREAES